MTLTLSSGKTIRIKDFVDKYEATHAEREAKAAAFADGSRPYMIFQPPALAPIYGNVRSSEDCFRVNVEYTLNSLELPSDHLHAFEAWFGTGVIPNVYGCPYVWRDDDAPCVHYRYHELDEVRGLRHPHWSEGEITKLVMETIRYFKARTGDTIPIQLTDTQSAHDNATLILDAAVVFSSCLLEPELILEFMRGINQVTIDFSKAQVEEIGDALVRPGRIMVSSAGYSGISLADDNLFVGSPATNAAINFPLNQEFGAAMGGVAIHSCGNWSHSMHLLKDLVPSCVAIDCAVDHDMDPNPCPPEKVRDAIAGTGIPLHARMTGDTEKMLETVKRLLHPDLRLIVRPICTDLEMAERNYAALESLLSDYYKAVNKTADNGCC